MSTAPTVLIVLLAMAIVPAQAEANGKCGDEPSSFGVGRLVDLWSIPIPEQAEVTYVDGELIDRLDRWAGSDVPEGFPDRYLNGIEEVDLLNPSVSHSDGSLVSRQARLSIAMKKRPLELFRKYFESGHIVFSTLIGHPAVSKPSEFSLCSIVLQRAVVIMEDGVESLTFRSYFHSSTADQQRYANFVPKQAVRARFRSEEVWFPLSLSEVIDHSVTYLVLDIVGAEVAEDSATGSAQAQLLRFRAPKLAIVEGVETTVTRVTAELRQGEQYSDLRLRVAGP